jgi:hypothetical protein
VDTQVTSAVVASAQPRVGGKEEAICRIEQAERFEFALNLKTAKTFDLTVPPGLLVAADEVIE